MDKKKKLAIVITHPIQYHAPLYKVINKAGLFDLHVIYRDDRGVRPFFDQFSKSYVSYDNNLLGGYSYEFLTKGEPKNIFEKIYRFLLPSLEKSIIASGADAVYFHGYNYLPYIRAIFRLRRKGIKIFLRGENEDVLGRPPLKNFLRELLLKILLPRIDAILYIGIENKNFFLRRGVPEEKLFFVPYSVDNEYFGINMPSKEKELIREKICEEYKIPLDSVIFINTCKHRIEKSPIDTVRGFIKAFEGLERSEERRAHLVLVGDGPLNAEMRAIVKESGLSNVTFTGYVNQSKLRELMMASDYMINSGAEPWGCTLNEALPVGLGIISSDLVVGYPDMVRQGENGFVYKFGDISGLSSDIKKCIENKNFIKKFSLVSKEIAREYSYENCVVGLNKAISAN